MNIYKIATFYRYYWKRSNKPKLMSNLVFYDENIERNLNLPNGLIMAEILITELTRAGMSKQTAYEL